MVRPIRTPMLPSRYQTFALCLNTSALRRMEKPITPPTRELNPAKEERSHTDVKWTFHSLGYQVYRLQTNRLHSVEGICTHTLLIDCLFRVNLQSGCHRNSWLRRNPRLLHSERKNDEGETEPNGRDYTECLAAFASSPCVACPLEMRWEAHLWAVKPLPSQAAGCLDNSLKTYFRGLGRWLRWCAPPAAMPSQTQWHGSVCL